MLSKYSPTVTLQRYWLFALLLLIPFSLKYLVLEPAISELNLISVGFIAIGTLNLLLKTIPYTPLRDKGTLRVIGLLVLAMAFALLFTHPLRNGLGLWTSRLLQPMLVGWFVYQMLSAKVLKVDEIVRTLLLSLIPMIIGGILQALHIMAPGVDPHRISLLYQYPNTFARYLEIILAVSIPWIILRNKVISYWELALWFAGVALLLTTKSYNGVVTLTAALVVVLLLLNKNYRKLQVRSLITIALLSVVVVVNAPKLPKWQASITDSRLSRLEFWRIAESVIKEHFWTGIGIKGWETGYEGFVRKYEPLPPLNWISTQPHNVFIDAMLKAGPLGLIAVVTLLLWPIIRGFQLLKSLKQDAGGWFGLSMIGYGVAMLLFGLIDDPIWSDDVTPLMYIFFMCMVWLYSTRKQSKTVTASS